MKQAEKSYLISDAAKQVQVEAHVLRYWEEELEFPVRRNEMGHRYYSEEDIMQFKKVKELKEQGLQLKGIKNMLKRGALKENATVSDLETEEDVESKKRHVVMVKKGEFLPVPETALSVHEESREQKSLRLQQLLKDMIAEAVTASNRELGKEIKDSILKELDYQFRQQEEREDAREKERLEREEAHFKQIDELLRAHTSKKKEGIFKKSLLGKKQVQNT